jgi:hypothetical protein
MAVFPKTTHPRPAISWRPLLLIMMLAAAALACNAPIGGPDDDSGESVAPLASIRPELALPEGWTAEEAQGGMVVAAADPADLDEQRQPSGPRLIVKPGQDSTSHPDTLVSEALADLAAVESTQVIEEATLIDLGQGNAIAITLSQGPTIHRIVSVNLGQGQAYQIIAEAPAGQWPTFAGQLESIIANVRFLTQ